MKINQCQNCKKDFKPHRKSYGLYCSNKCHQELVLQQKVDADICSARTAKKYLQHKDNSCSICGLTDWNNREIVLILDHIDGNSENNSLKNLRLVCPNCDSQLDTYKNRNKGFGRYHRRTRYYSGQSY